MFPRVLLMELGQQCPRISNETRAALRQIGDWDSTTGFI
jgi:hypothetical protein